MRNFELPGRSEALGRKAMAATSNPQATLVALDILKQGGNAVDAAISAAAVLAVVEPTQTGIGGDSFVLMKRRGEPVVALNGSGWAPRDASQDLYASRSDREINPGSADAVTVPGSVRAWERLSSDHGRMKLAQLLTPAIELAKDGYLVTERLARDWANQVGKLSANPTAARLLLRDGKAPESGKVMRQPELALALESIAQDGSAAFYEGWIADDIVATLRNLGGVHSLDDFREYQPFYVDPISTDYRGHTIWECPPSGQGLVVLAMARLLEKFDVAGLGSLSAERIHLLAEIARISYAERDLHICDPDFASVPVEELLSDARVAELAARIKPDSRLDRATPWAEPPHKDTTFVTVVDQDRTAVSLIASVYDDFGSGIVAPQSGVVLHNRACGFVLDPRHPNVVAGRKRPMHTIIPALVTKDGETICSFGVTGAHFQPIGQMQVLSNIIDFGMNIQEAIDHPRIFARGDVLDVESTVPLETIERLRGLGHRPTPAPHPLGTAQAIWISQTGILRGGADPRRDGVALGL